MYNSSTRRGHRALGAWLTALLVIPMAQADHVPANEIRTSLPPDAIPAIAKPLFDDGSWLGADDWVVGLRIGTDARAYPIRILVWHEIVDDTVGGEAVAVTYCPLCGTGLVFNRTLDGQPLVFKVSGKLYKNDLVMYDTRTESLWTQVLGEAIQGPLHGKQLQALGASLVRWKDWRADHPQTIVLSRQTGHSRDYDRDPYGGYAESRRIGISSEHRDDLYGLHPKEFVLGYSASGRSIAFRYSQLAEDGLAQVTFAGRRLVATFENDAAHLFLAANRTFTRQPNGLLQDEKGATYDPSTGIPDRGPALERVPALPAFWFAWFDFHPDTIVWGALGVQRVIPARGASGVSEDSPIVFEFSLPISVPSQATVRDRIEISPRTGFQTRWDDPSTLVVTPLPAWPEGRVDVRLRGALVDENGTTFEVDVRTFFSSGTAATAAPGLVVGVVVLMVAAVWIQARRRRNSS